MTRDGGVPADEGHPDPVAVQRDRVRAQGIRRPRDSDATPKARRSPPPGPSRQPSAPRSPRLAHDRLPEDSPPHGPPDPISRDRACPARRRPDDGRHQRRRRRPLLAGPLVGLAHRAAPEPRRERHPRRLQHPVQGPPDPPPDALRLRRRARRTPGGRLARRGDRDARLLHRRRSDDLALARLDAAGVGDGRRPVRLPRHAALRVAEGMGAAAGGRDRGGQHPVLRGDGAADALVAVHQLPDAAAHARTTSSSASS